MYPFCSAISSESGIIPFTFKVIIDRYLLINILLIVFGSSSVSLFSSLDLFLLIFQLSWYLPNFNFLSLLIPSSSASWVFPPLLGSFPSQLCDLLSPVWAPASSESPQERGRQTHVLAVVKIE